MAKSASGKTNDERKLTCTSFVAGISTDDTRRDQGRLYSSAPAVARDSSCALSRSAALRTVPLR